MSETATSVDTSRHKVRWRVKHGHDSGCAADLDTRFVNEIARPERMR
jgi:hypothetical protein